MTVEREWTSTVRKLAEMINDVFDDKAIGTGWTQASNKVPWADDRIPAAYREALLETAEEILGSDWFLEIVTMTARMTVDALGKEWERSLIGGSTDTEYVRATDVLKFLERQGQEIANE